MKKLSILLIAIITFSSCNKKIKKNTRNIIVGDTIKTGSGLQYILLEQGDGPKIEEGSKVSVYTDLYLNKDTSVFWTTSTAKDSLFTFIHGKTSLIKGFTELHDHLFEGDKVVAIIPYQIAYGEKERTGIPAKSTLIYDPLVVRNVSEAKEIIGDTLFSITKLESADKAIAFYKNASNANFHTDLNLLAGLFNNLRKEKLFASMETLSKFFNDKATSIDDKQRLYNYYIVALEAQGKIEEAVEILKTLSKQKPNQAYWKNYLLKLQDVLEKKNK